MLVSVMRQVSYSRKSKSTCDLFSRQPMSPRGLFNPTMSLRQQLNLGMVPLKKHMLNQSDLAALCVTFGETGAASDSTEWHGANSAIPGIAETTESPEPVVWFQAAEMKTRWRDEKEWRAADLPCYVIRKSSSNNSTVIVEVIIKLGFQLRPMLTF